MNPTITDEMTRRPFDRRQLLMGAGALSAVGIVEALTPATALADSGGPTGYQFLDVSDGKGAVTGKVLFMTGVGSVGSAVTGGGRFVIFDAASSQALDFGSWRASKLVSLDHVGTTVAGFLGATLTMDVILESANGGKSSATATVNCDGGAVSPNGGNGTGDVLTLVIPSGTFAGTFGPGSAFPFNVTIFIAPSG